VSLFYIKYSLYFLREKYDGEMGGICCLFPLHSSLKRRKKGCKMTAVVLNPGPLSASSGDCRGLCVSKPSQLWP